MPPWVKCLWVPYYAVKCVLYLVVDKFNRSAFNALFVNDFKGLSASEESKTAMAALIQKKYLAERVFPAAAAAVAALKRDDFRVVLVTGSLDFIIAPLAASLGGGCTSLMQFTHSLKKGAWFQPLDPAK
jgi:phosphoserine phosphatase